MCDFIGCYKTVNMFARSLVGRIIFFTCLCGLIAKGVSGCRPVSVDCEDIKTKDGFKYDFDCNCGLGTTCEIEVKNETEYLIGYANCSQQDCRLLGRDEEVVVGIDRNNTVLTTCLSIQVDCVDANLCLNYTAVGNDISDPGINTKISSTAIAGIDISEPGNNTKISSTDIAVIAVSVVMTVGVLLLLVVVLGCLYRKWKKAR
ncbi:uncharacterized protein [Nerophis lumbriciformis]|uniref:uncharacterized protein n=1 Tax=Nerophis lumbriciformis TaxID=546530 RepID=UPI002ADF1373|nr:uncharacterized protein LOC133620529 [Nerophis lumbriciformis]